MMWWPFGGMMGWWAILWMVIFWGAVVALIIWIVKKLTERGGSAEKHDPLGIAKERYAKGELSREEFEQIKKDLS